MKKVGLLLIGLIITIFANGQIVKIQFGTSISKMNGEITNIDVNSLYDETFIGYPIFVGIDYFDRKFFNLSSNIGMIRRGGKREMLVPADPFGMVMRTITEEATLDYLSINTMVDFKYRIKEKVSPFISIGPRFDYLVSSSKHFIVLELLDDLNSTSIGLIFGGGVKYDISNLQFGLRADYYLDFTKVAEWSAKEDRAAGKVSINTFVISLTVGYR
ncbi:MAG: PorT family protein [Dysgonamonadaceae bacterium]|jgi:hypothetical protein|nr:PorT family protein [Dysgonamonadaceae bacterium]